MSNPNKVFFPQRGETKLDLVRYYQAVGEPLLARIGGRPLLLRALPRRRRRASRSSRSACRSGARLARARPRSRTPNGTTSDALVAADLAHVAVGREPGLPRLPRLAVHAADPEHRRRAAHRPRPVARASTFDDGARGGRRGAGAPRRASASTGYAEDHRQPRPPHVRAAAAASGTATRCGPPRWRSPASSSGAAPTSSPPQWWKEERGDARLRRLQPERPAQDGVRRLVRAAPGRAARCRRRSPGTSSPTIDPDELTIATVPGARRRARATRGRRWTTRRSRLEPLLDAARPRPRRGLHGRAVAAACTRRCRTSRRGWRPAGPRARRRLKPPVKSRLDWGSPTLSRPIQGKIQICRPQRHRHIAIRGGLVQARASSRAQRQAVRVCCQHRN